MMICKSCGRTVVNEEANFCDYCGESQKGAVFIESNKQSMAQGVQKESKDKKEESFLNWFGSLMLIYIPLVGPIVFLVMLIIWSTSKETNITKRNWARAQIVVTVISLVIVVIFYAVIFTSLIASGFNMEQYFMDMESIYY